MEKKDIWKRIWQIGSAVIVIITLATTAIVTLGGAAFTSKGEFKDHVEAAEDKYVQYRVLDEILKPMKAQQTKMEVKIDDIHKYLIER